MEKRFVLFLLLAVLIMSGHLFVATIVAPPPELDPQQEMVEREELDPLDDAPGLADIVRPDELIDEPIAQEDAELALADEDPEEPPAEARWVTIGSAAADSPLPWLITFTSEGGGIERFELFKRGRDGRLKYRDLDNHNGYLGHLALQPVTGGLQVRVVGPGTPAALARPLISGAAPGLQAGDVLKQAGQRQLQTPAQLTEVLRETSPGDELPLVVERQVDERSETLEFVATLMEHPLELISPEPQADGTHNPPSARMTLANIGGDEGVSSEVGGPEIENLKSLKEGYWHVTTSEDPPSVEFRMTLTPQDLQRVGLAGSWEVIKRFNVTDVPAAQAGHDNLPYHLQMDIELRNLGQQPQTIAYRLEGPNGLPIEGWWYSYKLHPDKIFAAAGARDVAWRAGRYDHTLLEANQIYRAAREGTAPTSIFSIDDPEERRQLHHIGIDTQYFAAVYVPGTIEQRQPFAPLDAVAMPATSVDHIDQRARARTTNVTFELLSSPVEVGAGESFQQQFVLFAGPKDPEVLASYGLPEYIEYGWAIFEVFARPLGAILHMFYWFVGNYGLAIILLTVLVRGCMFPISRKAAKSAQKMQELAPELKKISEKYKGDLEKQRKAQKELYEKHNFNPFGSCLLMLFQLPVFIGLFRCLSVDIELRQAALIPGIQWASNLAAPDMLFRWDWMLPEFLAGEGTGWLGPYFNILPLITVALFLVQQKMFTPPPTDEQTRAQHRVMTFMMIFMGFLFFRIPSGLCLYFIVSSLWSIVERKMLPKSPTQQQQAAVSQSKPAPKPRRRPPQREGKNGSSAKPGSRKKQKKR